MYAGRLGDGQRTRGHNWLPSCLDVHILLPKQMEHIVLAIALWSCQIRLTVCKRYNTNAYMGVSWGRRSEKTREKQ